MNTTTIIRFSITRTSSGVEGSITCSPSTPSLVRAISMLVEGTPDSTARVEGDTVFARTEGEEHWKVIQEMVGQPPDWPTKFEVGEGSITAEMTVPMGPDILARSIIQDTGG